MGSVQGDILLAGGGQPAFEVSGRRLFKPSYSPTMMSYESLLDMSIKNTLRVLAWLQRCSMKVL